MDNKGLRWETTTIFFVTPHFLVEKFMWWLTITTTETNNVQKSKGPDNFLHFIFQPSRNQNKAKMYWYLTSCNDWSSNLLLCLWWKSTIISTAAICSLSSLSHTSNAIRNQPNNTLGTLVSFSSLSYHLHCFFFSFYCNVLDLFVWIKRCCKHY